MSYLVLARKWRPRVFDDVVGQDHVTRTLCNALAQDRVAHALLFTGSRGVGKTSCARILAKALNCQSGPTPNPCGTCPACVEITNGSSPDVLEIDGASNNGVEQVREIRESVKFLPSRGKRKMYIIDEVHMLTTAAFNALLKTLEEPPPHVLFVFATTEAHKIPDTILSRCQRFDFKRIPERKMVEAIAKVAAAEGVTVEPAALHHLAREAEGGMRDSLSLLDQVISFCGTTITEAQVREVLGIADRGILSSLADAIVEGDAQRALLQLEELHNYGADLQKFAAELVTHFRDLMVVKVCAEPARLVDVPDAELDRMASFVRQRSPAQLHRLFSAMMQGAEDVARSPFPKLALEMVVLRLCAQGPTLPLSEILTGLTRLEARLGDGGGGGGGGRMPTPESRPEVQAPRDVVPPSQTTSNAAARPESHLTLAARLLSSGGVPATVSAVREPAAVREPEVSQPPPLHVSPLHVSPLIVHAPPAPCFEPTAEPSGPGCVGGDLTSVPLPFLVTDDEGAPLGKLESPFPQANLHDGRSATEHFAAFIEGVRGRDTFLAAHVKAEARLLQFDAERLIVVVTTTTDDDLQRSSDSFEGWLKLFVGRPVSFTVERRPEGHADLAGETLSAREHRLDTERRAARIEAARQDPAVQIAVSLLGARIERVLPFAR